MDDYLVPANRVEHEINISNSRFIASLAPAPSRSAAERFISEVKQKYPDAAHHVPAYIVGHGSSSLSHASDDGEPSGTAGRPALAVLEGSDLGDTTVVITRYFGGTKLGTGGLVRAYSDAVRGVLNKAHLARKVKAHRLELTTPYSFYERIVRIIKNSQGLIEDEQFTSDIKMVLKMPADHYRSFSDAVLEISAGNVKPIILEENIPAILPVKTRSDEGQSNDDA